MSEVSELEALMGFVKTLPGVCAVSIPGNYLEAFFINGIRLDIQRTDTGFFSIYAELPSKEFAPIMSGEFMGMLYRVGNETVSVTDMPHRREIRVYGDLKLISASEVTKMLPQLMKHADVILQQIKLLVTQYRQLLTQTETQLTQLLSTE